MEVARRSLGDVDLVVAQGFRVAPHRIEILGGGLGHDAPALASSETPALVAHLEGRGEHRLALDDVAGLARFIAARLDTLRAY